MENVEMQGYNSHKRPYFWSAAMFLLVLLHTKKRAKENSENPILVIEHPSKLLHT
jgi:hypothetical protein